MRIKIALLAIVAALVCVSSANAASCDVRTYAGAVCAVQADIAAYDGYPGQTVRCYYAPRGRRVGARWSCYAGGNHYVVSQSTGRVYLKLTLWIS